MVFFVNEDISRTKRNLAIEILESNLNPSKKQIRFTDVLVYLQDRSGTGEM